MKRLTTALVGVVAALAFASPAAADFGFVPNGFTAPIHDGDGVEVTQAGAHADATVDFMLNSTMNDTGAVVPDQSLRNVRVDMPRGLVGNPLSTPRCRHQEFKAMTCAAESIVGVEELRFAPIAGAPVISADVPVYNLVPPEGVAARFAFQVTSVVVMVDMTVASDGDYHLVANLRDLATLLQIHGSKLTLWGVPADNNGPGPYDVLNGETAGGPGEGPRRPFLAAPTQCGPPLTTTISASSWQDDDSHAEASYTPDHGISGCDALEFAPSIAVTPASREAGQPSAYAVDLSVPQSDDPDGLATPSLKDAVVRLPEGVALSPAVASGLEACSDGQLALDSTDAERCPGASRIGTVKIDTPVLDAPMSGSLYVGSQRSDDPESGEMYRLFLTAYGSGVRIKLRGSIRLDRATGQITASFLDNPQLPFSKMSLAFKGGDRAPLVNPSVCGTHTATTTLASWGGQTTSPSSAFTIDQGCPTGRFAPTLTAGTTGALAGTFSPFTMTVGRADGDQDLSRIDVALPPGLLAALGSVPLCPEANAAAGNCDAISRIGSTTVAVGSGGAPFVLPGQVYLAGPYKGAPFSMSVVVPAKAGPFDLGLVVVRIALHVDANRAQVTAVSDPLPTIVGGVPLHMRTVDVTLDRPGFTFDATSCEASAVAGAFTSTGGTTSSATVPYQPRGCDRLVLDPKLSLEYSGKTQMRTGKHPGITANLADTFGQANMKSIKVTLPLTAALDPDNAEALCEPAGAAARNCPAASQIGWASATTPALHDPIQGPVYFVKGTRIGANGKLIPTLPKLFLKLTGEGVAVDLHADSSVDGKKRLTTTFTGVPDVPVRDFRLTINNGKRGILKATNDVCGADKATTVEFTGHNGARTVRKIAVAAPSCVPQVLTATRSGSDRLAVRVAGVGAGKLTLGGARITRTTATVGSGDSTLVRVRLTRATVAELARGEKVKVAVKVTYAPKSGATTAAGQPAKRVSFTKRVTLKGKKGSTR
jgi:hypothetical protein